MCRVEKRNSHIADVAGNLAVSPCATLELPHRLLLKGMSRIEAASETSTMECRKVFYPETQSCTAPISSAIPRYAPHKNRLGIMHPALGVSDVRLLLSVSCIGRIAVTDQGAAELTVQHLFNVGASTAVRVGEHYFVGIAAQRPELA